MLAARHRGFQVFGSQIETSMHLELFAALAERRFAFSSEFGVESHEKWSLVPIVDLICQGRSKFQWSAWVHNFVRNFYDGWQEFTTVRNAHSPVRMAHTGRCPAENGLPTVPT
jgi:hypothetical protein